MSAILQKIKAVKDEDGHWFVIPEELLASFLSDLEDEGMLDGGEFDSKWGKYRTGGDLNLIQLWAEI